MTNLRSQISNVSIVLRLTRKKMQKKVGVPYIRKRRITGTDAKILYGIIDIIIRRESEKQ